MDLSVKWHKRVPLKNGDKYGLIYSIDLKVIPKIGGIYVFGRSFGSTFEALYVGKATNLQNRIKGQLNNLKLMNHIKNASIGKRFVLVGEFDPKPGQQQDVCLKHLERAFIRHYLSEGHDLVNIMGTKLKRHSISSAGQYPKKWWPSAIFIEK